MVFARDQELRHRRLSPAVDTGAAVRQIRDSSPKANAAGEEGFRAEAFAATWAADHDRALAALHNAPWLGSNVMRARIYARKGLVERALAEFRRAAELRGDREETAELATIAAILLGGRGRRVEAILALHEAEMLVAELTDRALRAQYLLAVAKVESSSGNTADARTALAAALGLTEVVDVAQARDYRLEVNHIRARLFEMRAHLHALDFDYAAQLDDLCRAIATAKLVKHRDLWHEAGLLANISNVVGMFPQTSARLLFASTSADVRWNPHLDHRETAVRFNIARSETLFGVGEDLAVLPGRGAPSLAARLALDADRLLFDEFRDPAQYERELEFASSLTESVDWGSVTGDEILGLATLAVLLAPFDLTRALAVKSLYDLMLPKLSRELASFFEPRRVAFDDFVSACLKKAQGEIAGAAELLGECISFWAARGMDPWCAIAALERFPISRAESDLEPARRFIAERPRSRFSARLRDTLATIAREPQTPFPYLRARTSSEVGPAG